jgi:hypothetical protein
MSEVRGFHGTVKAFNFEPHENFGLLFPEGFAIKMMWATQK